MLQQFCYKLDPNNILRRSTDASGHPITANININILMKSEPPYCDEGGAGRQCWCGKDLPGTEVHSGDIFFLFSFLVVLFIQVSSSLFHYFISFWFVIVFIVVDQGVIREAFIYVLAEFVR